MKIVKGVMHSGKGNRKHNDHDWMDRDKKNVIIKTYAYVDDLPEDKKTENLTTDNLMDSIMWVLDTMGKDTRDDRRSELMGKAAEDELTLYRHLYGETLRVQNEKYRKKRNYSRVKTMEDWLVSNNHNPVEDILQIGNMDTGDLPVDILTKCVDELQEWEKKTLGRNVQPISVAVHLDETTNHVHKRDTYVYWGDDGLPYPCVKMALEQAGIPLPDPTKPESKKNNRKKQYDNMRREAWYDIIEKHLPKDYVLDRVPDSKRPEHESVKDYKARKAMEQAQALQTELLFAQKRLEADMRALAVERENYKADVEKELKQAYTVLEDQLKRSYAESEKELGKVIAETMAIMDEYKTYCDKAEKERVTDVQMSIDRRAARLRSIGVKTPVSPDCDDFSL